MTPSGFINNKPAFIFLGLCMLFITRAQAQQFSRKVHELPEVRVVAERSDFYAEDQKVTTLDSSRLSQHRSNDLGELLSGATPVYIKSYGASGAVAAPNFRGTSAHHTSVSWNGFPINSLTLGQCDLSLTPAEFADKVTLTHSAPSTLYGNGTFGGAIAMENQVEWNKRQSLSFSGELGSWNNQRYGLRGEFGNERLQYKLGGIYQQALNNFKYQDDQQFGRPVKRRQHNAVENLGIMNNFFFKQSGRSRFEAGIWYQHRDKELPGIMGVTGQSHASQKDSSLRAYAGWKGVFDQSSIQIKSAFFYHHQLYKEKENPQDETYRIHSPITTNKWMNDINYRYYLNNRITVDMGLQYSHIRADVEAYSNPVKEYRAAVIGAIKYKTQNLTTNLSLRQQLNTYTSPPPQVSLGANFRPDQNWFVRAHFSTKYRLPTLNDKYWQPGGNKDLRPERGWTGEVGTGYTFDHQILQAHTTVEVTAYQSNIHQMIEWIPMEGASFWHPINTSRARTTGMEASLNHRLQWNRLQLELHTMYNYTQAMNMDQENPDAYRSQLRYTPYHLLKNNLNVSFRQYSLGTTLQYTGERYATIDNDPSGLLEDYMMMHLSLGRQVDLDSMKGNIRFTVKNLFDRQYQVIANYPMPGRAYYVNLNIQLNQLF